MSYILLKKAQREPPQVKCMPSPSHLEVAQALDRLSIRHPLAIDIETTGLDPKRDAIDAIGFYDGVGPALSISTRSPAILQQIVRWWNTNSVRWFAFNTPFDGAFLGEQGVPMDLIQGDALVMFKLMSTEGWLGQRWNLDTAITDVLGWSLNSKQVWEDKLKEAKLGKAEMWKAFDLDPIGYLTYNALDAAAAWQLMVECRQQARDREFSQVVEVHDNEFNSLIKLTIEQHLRGIQVDREEALRYEEELTAEIEIAERRFKTHPTVRATIEQWDNTATASATVTTTTEKKVWAKKSDSPWSTPGWVKGEREKPSAWEKTHGSWYKLSTTTKIKHKKITGLFNLASSAHRCDLFYNRGLFNWSIDRHPNRNAKNEWERTGTILIPTEDGHIAERSMTKKDGLPTDADTLAFFGEAGRLYGAWADLVKRKQFVTSLLELSDNEEGVWHPAARVFGTITGRSSAGE